MSLTWQPTDREQELEDPLAASFGIFLGVILGSAMWLGLGLAIVEMGGCR